MAQTGYLRSFALAMPAIFLGFFGTQVRVILERRDTLLLITSIMTLANGVRHALGIPRFGVPEAIASTAPGEYGIGLTTVAVMLFHRPKRWRPVGGRCLHQVRRISTTRERERIRNPHRNRGRHCRFAPVSPKSL